jgi:pimeloyl-ACP methyl ester carboxylesterase
VHVCDLGLVDNSFGYGALSLLEEGDARYEIVTWNNHLRKEPWQNLENLPNEYPDYVRTYKSVTVEPPFDRIVPQNVTKFIELPQLKMAAAVVDIQEQLTLALNLDPARVSAEQNTGIYQSHWGGLEANTLGASAVLDTLRYYVNDCQENDAKWAHFHNFIGRNCTINVKSLEHKSMIWQLRGDSVNGIDLSNNWLAGESLVRYLAAPLLFGTVSPRRVWYMTNREHYFFASPLKQLVEGREWHCLLAAHNLRKERANPETVYLYWRYQGFLCRYAQTDFKTKENICLGILLVHGFGASGEQWNKAMAELKEHNEDVGMGLAPDLIGFGHSEKPALSYTGYMWDSQVLDFVKEIASAKLGWESYVVGGNSIGGFTSLQLAACDTATVGSSDITSSGAPGSNICSGLVLMNSAGPLISRKEIELDNKGRIKSSIAQTTAEGGLQPCKPPPRLIARGLGNGLLAYLRPRIQSICVNLYPTNPAAVDDSLCDSIRRDSLDPGAINVMMAGAKLPPPRTVNELLSADFGASLKGTATESTFRGPVLIAQGVLDPLNDASERMRSFGSLREGITMDPINAGHCPHDELPGEVAKSITSWMTKTRAQRKAQF